jgi:NAD(P)H-quinone oxidoreductase subunit 5
MAIPTVVLLGMVLHEPQLLATWGLVKDWTILTQPTAIALITSSALGIVSGAALYCNDTLTKPIQFPLKSVQDFLAYDLYTPQLYKMSIVSVVDRISKFADWLDRNLVDGVGQFFGLATLFSGQSLRYSTAGQSQVYMLTIVIGLGLLVLLAFNIKL